MTSDRDVVVLGAGSWGTVIASLVSFNASTASLWARDAQFAREIKHSRRNSRYLPSFEIPESVNVVSDFADVCRSANVIFVAVPSHGFRAIVNKIRPYIPNDTVVVSLAKGVESITNATMTQIICDDLPQAIPAVLTGPNLAGEIALAMPSASVVACKDRDAAHEVQSLFHHTALRVYTSDDVVGCEIAGSVKNVLAIAAGIGDGMGFGSNTKAALITRGVAELTRLGVALGGKQATFAGLAGVGDLIATCTSGQSRNRSVGEDLGKGALLNDIVGRTSMVAEGVKSCEAICALATENGVEMPISFGVLAVLRGEIDAQTGLAELLARELRAE